MQDLASIVNALRRTLRKSPRYRMALYAAAAAASSILVRLMRTRALQTSHHVAPVSELFRAVEAGRVAQAVTTFGACAFHLVDKGDSVYRTTLLPADAKLLVSLLHKHAVPYRSQGPPGWRSALVLLVPFAYLGVCGWLLHRMTSGDGPLGGGQPPSDNNASGGDDNRPAAVTWGDVAGLPRIKSAVMEVVDVMQRPQHYARLGARCPRGVLLAGPPGTGKTLLARAVAAEAGVPFLSCTGSDFVEVFVGRGAKRVRSLFEEARRAAPCVLFIDELDALGSSRNMRGGGGSEEHDQTLNQLLAMMDGMGSTPGVLVMAATNRLVALDPALTRPGRFDRVLQLELPDEADRLAILKVHVSKTSMETCTAAAAEALLTRLARQTTGFSGAELANIVNEAAINAVRAGEASVRGEHLEQAVTDFKASRAPPEERAQPHSNGGGKRADQMREELAQGLAMLQAMGLAPGRGPARQAAAGGGGSIEENE